jgi:RHS repeat-associated protein
MFNRTSLTDLAGVHHYTYDPTYQLTQATHPNMPTEVFTYDQAGNRLSAEGQAPPEPRDTEYQYDFENRLTNLIYQGMEARYKYDPFGRRIEKNLNGVITRYLYDGSNIVAEYDESGEVKAQYTHTLTIDDPLTITQGENSFFYHQDGVGSVVNLTDASGNVAKGYTYKSFGEVHQETGSMIQPFTFTGREYDPQSGLYFYRARYYDPRAGRFVTKDPIGFLGGDVNLYRYVQNNPLNYRDPLGLWPPGIHNRIIAEAFRDLPEHLRMAIEAGSQYADTFQDPQYAYMHAMRSSGQSVNEAKRAMEKFIEKHLDNYRCKKQKGNYYDAFFQLGMALHPVMDSTSPPHRGFQVWNGLSDMAGHWLAEREISTQQIQDTVKNINRTLFVYGITLK